METLPETVLFVSDPELGQLNVQLATSYALLTLYENVHVHFASLPSAAGKVATTSDQALEACGTNRLPIHFHALACPSQADCFDTMPQDVVDNFASRTSWRNFYKQPRRSLVLASPWNKEQFMHAYWEVKRVIDAVKPHIMAVDPMFAPALAATRDSGVRFHLLMPTTLKDVVSGPDAIRLPAVGTAWPFPLPWYVFPLNFVIMMMFWVEMKLSTRSKTIKAYVREKSGFEPPMLYAELLDPPLPGLKTLIPVLPEMDYPLASLSEYMVPCGPIQRPAQDLAEADPELNTWLAKGPTIFISLGSHRIVTEEWAVEMAGALKMVFVAASSAAKEQSRPELRRLRVLWKLAKTGRSFLGVGKKNDEYDTKAPGSKVHDILGDEIDQGRVKIVDWLTTEPLAVLKSGNIVCAVHHGGANSGIETISAGVPHVVLPAWADCFDWAARVEYLGIGRFGSKTSTPNWKSKELGNVLVDVVCSPEGVQMREKAMSLKALVDKAPPGREVAARELMRALPEGS